MCFSLIHCTAACELRRCLMPGGLLSAISGILAGGILGFGAAEWFVLLDTFARSCTVVWCFSFVSVQDPVIHWHISCRPLQCCLVSPLAVFGGFLFVFFVCVCFCCLALGLFFVIFGPVKTSDFVLVRTPLLTPQGGTLILHMDNSFISTTMCDDLARATEARDGKKKITGSICLRDGRST